MSEVIPLFLLIIIGSSVAAAIMITYLWAKKLTYDIQEIKIHSECMHSKIVELMVEIHEMKNP